MNGENGKKSLAHKLVELFPEDLDQVSGGGLLFETEKFSKNGGSAPGGWEDNWLSGNNSFNERWDAQGGDSFGDRFGSWDNNSGGNDGGNWGGSFGGSDE